MISVLLADDQALVRSGFRLILETREDIEVVGEAENGREAIDLARHVGPDVILMDVRMPDMDGIEAARRVAAECPEVKVLLVSAEPLVSPAADLLRSRAAAFSRKQNFGPAMLRLLNGRQDASAAPGTQP